MGFCARSPGRSGGDEFVWIIDPLDGTTNFLHGFPVFAVSIAVEYRGRLEHAVIYDPMRQELFTASRGDGAQLDGKRIRVSKQITLEGALIGTGFPYRANTTLARRVPGDARSPSCRARRASAGRARHRSTWPTWRRAGSTASGKSASAPWDTAAGTLLILEAGGRVGTLTGEPYAQGGHIVAGTPKVFDALVGCIAPHVPATLARSLSPSRHGIPLPRRRWLG